MKNSLIYLFLVFFPGSMTTLYGQENDEENKFNQPIQEFPFSQPVYLQEVHEFQQTLHGAHAENDEEIVNTLGYEAEYGITDWLQISAGYSFEHHNLQNTPFDTGWLETGVVIGLLNNSRQAMALSMEVEFPVNKTDLEDIETEDSPAYTPTFIYAFQFSKTQLHLNAGAEFQEDEVDWFYNAAAVYGNGTLHPVVEINLVSEEEFIWYAGTGLVLNNESGWEIGAGFRHGINRSDWNAIIHLVYELSLEKEKESS